MKQVVDFHPVFDPCPEWVKLILFHFIKHKGKRKETILCFYKGLHVVYRFNRLDIELGEMGKRPSLQLQGELLPQVHSELQQISVLCSTSPAAWLSVRSNYVIPVFLEFNNTVK